jgi:hypothetical protein
MRTTLACYEANESASAPSLGWAKWRINGVLREDLKSCTSFSLRSAARLTSLPTRPWHGTHCEALRKPFLDSSTEPNENQYHNVDKGSPESAAPIEQYEDKREKCCAEQQEF